MKLIIGATGYIGSHIYNYFSQKEKIIGTCYGGKEEGMIEFDLENPDLENLKINLGKIDCAFICAAISKIDECKRDEKTAYRINVEGTKKLLEQCFDAGIFPIWFSSDFVFDGKRGEYTEQDKTNPITAYGGHKKIIEDFLLSSKKEFLIARLSKVFGLEMNDGTLITSWLKQLKNNEEVKCASDQIFCPTEIGDLVKALEVALEKNLRGLYNIASPEAFSRFNLATKLKTQLGIKTGKIIPCLIKDFNFLDNRSLSTSINSRKFRQETGFKFSTMSECIEKLRKFI